ncbi:MAG: MATE family efflux transporter [Planctomycetes bacterium]|nr:MATE family efflux transporter [Planctomycetota bacterium]
MPMIAGNLIRTTFELVDMAFVGRLGKSALAAVGMSALILMLLNTVFMGIATAATALVARAVGAGDSDRANHVAAQSITLTLALSILLSIAGFWLAPLLLELLGAKQDVVLLGTGYMHLRFMGLFAMLSLFIGAGILRGAGDVITPLIVSAVGAVLNIFLDAALIFGLWGLPRLEVNGAALATVLSQVAVFAIGMKLLTGGHLRVRVAAAEMKPDPATIGLLVRIGIPNSVGMSLRFLMNLVLTRIVAKFGTGAVAAFTIGGRLQSLGFMPTFAVAQTAATLVGQNLGAKKEDRAQRGALLCTAAAVAIMFTASVLGFAFAPYVVRLFNSDPEVLSIGSTMIRIAAIGYPFAAISIVLNRSISGAGDTVPPMIFNLLILWVLQVPLAVWLAGMERFGVTGVWWAGAATSIVSAAAATTYFFLGRWKRLKIH